MKVDVNLKDFFAANYPTVETITDDAIVILAGGFKITIRPSVDADDCAIFEAKFEVI